MNKFYFEVRRKDNGKVVETFPSEVKAMGWFQRQYTYSFSTALLVGDYDVYRVEYGTGKETKIVP